MRRPDCLLWKARRWFSAGGRPGTRCAATTTMTTVFAYGWKSLAWRGIIGVSFGIVTLLWPGISLAILVLLFGVYALFDGIAAIVLGTRDRAREHSWALLLEGFAGIGLGLAIFLWTRMAAELLVVVIAFWAVAT